MVPDSDGDGFFTYYDRAHRNPLNRYIHHTAHTLAVVGALLILLTLPMSWAGHYVFERNTPALFDALTSPVPRASVAKKLQIALGGVLWSGLCFWRLLKRWLYRRPA